MTQLRGFRNTDPPLLLDLWHACNLGRGAADDLTCDALEMFNFGQPYFESECCVLAFEGDLCVGAVLSGFGSNEQGSALDYRRGVVCLILVRPEFRRRGLGRQLLASAVTYLKSCGATEIVAGGAPEFNPYLVGMYGGSQPAGFLLSDENADPFLKQVGFEPIQSVDVYSRDMATSRDPMHFKLMQNRRKFELKVLGEPPVTSWWWATRFGRLDSLRFLLVPRGEGPAVAALTVVGLDMYIPKWKQRAVGVIDLYVPEQYRKKGYAQTLIIEVCRKLKAELVTLVEIHAPRDNPAVAQTLKSCNFEHVDEGIVYRLSNQNSS